ncbi:MAG: hypothetical protein ACEY3H_02505 [Wolbachia sp.]
MYMVNDVIPVWNPENLPGNKNWIPVSRHWDDTLLVEIALKSQCSYSKLLADTIVTIVHAIEIAVNWISYRSITREN